jgi:hypothetical protein
MIGLMLLQSTVMWIYFCLELNDDLVTIIANKSTTLHKLLTFTSIFAISGECIFNVVVMFTLAKSVQNRDRMENKSKELIDAQHTQQSQQSNQERLGTQTSDKQNTTTTNSSAHLVIQRPSELLQKLNVMPFDLSSVPILTDGSSLVDKGSIETDELPSPDF